MFGYPANLCARSNLTMGLAFLDAMSYLGNNCGDPDSNAKNDDDNNYAMDTKLYEKEVVKTVAENLGIFGDVFGYITSGGSESNQFAIVNGFTNFPGATAYYCQAAHYSIAKALDRYPMVEIAQKSEFDESVDVQKLVATACEKWHQHKMPAVIMTTFGTTKFGSIDNVSAITKELKSSGVPYYLHIDAAFFGGIPNNQIDAPRVGNWDKLGADSISVSLHKYIGYPQVGSVFISNKRRDANIVEYIGQADNTFCGSRSIPAFSLLQHTRDVLNSSEPHDYSRNIKITEQYFISANLPFLRQPKSNIFVVYVDAARPGFKAVCKKYQLSGFTDIAGRQCLHVITFPFHRPEIISELTMDLARISDMRMCGVLDAVKTSCK